MFNYEGFSWRRQMLALGAGSLLAVFAAVAHGQTENEEADDDDADEVVVVTGSRIVRSNLVSASPVTQVDAEELLFQGTVRVEDMARTLPQVYSGQNTSQSNGATGTATLNLRNLGWPRTLTLINGRRMPIGSPIQGGGGADINQVPGALVRSVEVLTGGASATYGSDAVAGVVNFLMKDDFQGFRIDYQHSGYQHRNDASRWRQVVEDSGYPAAQGSINDGEMKYLSVILGGNFDDGRGNITAYGTYRDIKAVWQANRDYSSCALSDNREFCFGSSTIPQGRFTNFGATSPSVDYIVQGHEFVPRQGETFNYGSLNYYQRPDEQYSIGSFAHYAVNDKVEAYAEFMYMDDRTVSQIAPSGNFFRTSSLNCGNPLLSEQQFETVCGSIGLTRDDTRSLFWIGRRNLEGGNRRQDLRHTTFRGVLGFRGEINQHWNYDISYLRSEVSMENTYMNDLGVTKIRRALDAVRNANGEIVCRSVVDGTDPNCVPWNIFQEGGVTQAALDYIRLPLFARGTTDQRVMTAYVAGDLAPYGIRSPAAETAVAVVLGIEQRQENMEFNPDEGFRNGDGAGQGGATPAVGGGYDVSEWFFEADIPLVEGRPGMEEVSLDLAYRNTEYDYGVTANTFGVRVGWAINHDVKLRGSFQRAIRGASLRELFQPQGFNLFDMTGDPCGGPVTGGTTAEGRTLEECARSGVTAAQFGNIAHSPAGQYNYLQGGNPDLDPEEADTLSFGIVYTPRILDGLTVSLDYYSIQIEEGISNLTPEFILSECLDGNQSQCRNVKRGIPGDLWIGSDLNSSGHVVALQDNLAIEEVTGYDLLMDYSMDVGQYGSLNFANVTSYITQWDQKELAGAPTEECAGMWGGVCGFPTPEVRNKLRVIWTSPWDLTLTGMWRYFSSVEDYSGIVELDSVSYFDVSAIWNARQQLELRAGVNNVTDADPPIAGNGAGPSIQGNGNTFPGMYDALGRYWFVAAGFSF